MYSKLLLKIMLLCLFPSEIFSFIGEINKAQYSIVDLPYRFVYKNFRTLHLLFKLINIPHGEYDWVLYKIVDCESGSCGIPKSINHRKIKSNFAEPIPVTIDLQNTKKIVISYGIYVNQRKRVAQRVIAIGTMNDTATLNDDKCLGQVPCIVTIDLKTMSVTGTINETTTRKEVSEDVISNQTTQAPVTAGPLTPTNQVVTPTRTYAEVARQGKGKAGERTKGTTIRPVSAPVVYVKGKGSSVIKEAESSLFKFAYKGGELSTLCDYSKIYNKAPYSLFWYHMYQDNRSLSEIPTVWNKKVTYYNIKVEAFDNDTKIFCAISTTFNTPPQALSPTNIRLLSDKERNDTDTDIVYYSENQDMEFVCRQYSSVSTKSMFIGIVNTTLNKIKTYKTDVKKLQFNSNDNGTMVCCLFYVIENTNLKATITRHVINKTLYFMNYQKSSTDGTIFWVIALLLAALFAVIIFFWIRNRTKSKMPPTVELETYGTSNTIIYADLDIGRGSQRRPNPPEEVYAEIIGVIKP